MNVAFNSIHMWKKQQCAQFIFADLLHISTICISLVTKREMLTICDDVITELYSWVVCRHSVLMIMAIMALVFLFLELFCPPLSFSVNVLVDVLTDFYENTEID